MREEPGRNSKQGDGESGTSPDLRGNPLFNAWQREAEMDEIECPNGGDCPFDPCWNCPFTRIRGR